ncbi:MAG: hypothetical protein WAV56_04280, partial [Microgenomates group bacterium]
EKDGFYHITDEFVARCYKASLVIEPTKSDGKAIYANGNFVGLVSQNPDDPRVMNQGKWAATIYTVDGGAISIGPFATESEALDTAIRALSKGLTFKQWQTETEFPIIN